MMKGGVNQMLLELRLFMTLHDERGLNHMFLDLCFGMTLRDGSVDGDFWRCCCSHVEDRSRKPSKLRSGMLLELCFFMKLHDERGGFSSNASGPLLLYPVL